MAELIRGFRLLAMALLPLPLLAQSPGLASAEVEHQPAQALALASSQSPLARPAKLEVSSLPLDQAITELQARSNTPMVFSPSLFPSGREVACLCMDLTVGEALSRMLTGLPLRYAEVGEYVVIEPAPERRARPEEFAVQVASAGVELGVTRAPVAESPPLREFRGTVVDRLTGSTLEGAVVEMEGTKTRAVTAADGRFRMMEPLSGEARMRVFRPGYHPTTARVSPDGAGARVELKATLFSREQGTIRGSVVDRSTNQPLEAVQVYLEGTSHNTLTRADGEFIMLNVPTGTYTVIAQMIGYAVGREENVRVAAGGVAQVSFALSTRALSLEGVVVTGVTDPVSGVKVPFTVSKLTAEDMPVATTASAIANVQGKIPGVTIVRGSGQPGTGVSIQLRSPTSMIRSNTPMFVVDGVILGSSVGGTTLDVESLDIESIEVIKGAAAAALYGSRAASGVVSITTARGSNMALDQTRITARSEFGTSAVPKGVPLATAHFYETDGEGQFVDEQGVVTEDPERRVVDVDRMMDNDYPNPLYDNVDEFYQPGRFLTNQVSVGRNSASTNFLMSLNNYQEKGSIISNDGYERTNFRVNLDHRLTETLTLSSSAYHNRSHRDDLSGDPFWDLLMYPPDINLGARDEAGNYIQQPDPLVLRENPIWRQTSRDNYNDRVRTLMSGNGRFRPTSWLSFDGTVSYDRSDRTYTIYVPKGTPFVSTVDDDVSLGRLDKTEYFNETINASASMNLLWNFGDLTTRTSLRGLLERETYTRITADARDFWVEGVENLGVAQRMLTSGYYQEVRANGYMGTLGLDYQGKYIGDLLVRRDGSSLFGPRARWATYYRASGAYRMAEEPWWPFDNINEFKLRFSQGTSGGRPSFADQYETWSVSSSGSVSKSTLGNRGLEPEHTTEREFGVDMIFLDRFQLGLTYAFQRTTDQIIQIPQPAVTGYSNQYQNSGTIEGTTYEATLEANLINRRDLQWSSTLIADRMRSEFTEWNRVCYIPSSGYAYRCEGMNHTQFYGERFLTSPNDIPEWHQGSRDQFALNDDGYLVAVGDGSYTDGRWGEFVEIDGRSYKWGHPILETDADGNPVLQVVGEGFPDFTMGWMNHVRWKNLRFYAQLHAQIGGEVYNHTKQRLYQHFRSEDLQQTGKPDDLKKPIDYYQTLYEANNLNSHFVEPGGYLKLREVSVRYTMGSELLARLGLDRLGTDQITLGLVGRNLLTFTDYSGFDPEVGNAFIRADYFSWPNTRTITGMIEIQF
jgi:TonB-linked SusC/RagA family outer membrane protein